MEKQTLEVATMKLEKIALWLSTLDKETFTDQDMVASRIACGYLMALVAEFEASKASRLSSFAFNNKEL